MLLGAIWFIAIPKMSVHRFECVARLYYPRVLAAFSGVQLKTY